MKTVIGGFFSSLTAGPRLLLALFALGFPLALLGHYTHTIELFRWLAFSPHLVWSGQVWRLLTYAFVPPSVLDWLVSLFWLTTMVCVLARNWHGLELWAYCLLSTVTSSLLLTLLHALLKSSGTRSPWSSSTSCRESGECAADCF